MRNNENTPKHIFIVLFHSHNNYRGLPWESIKKFLNLKSNSGFKGFLTFYLFTFFSEDV